MGAIYRNSAAQVPATYYQGIYQPIVSQDINSIWLSMVNGPHGEYFINRFASSPSGWWRTILYDQHLTPVQKFEYIFGFRLPQQQPNAPQLIGDVFEWIGNLFSAHNLQNAELFLRQGEAVINNFANGLNYVSNQPSVQQQALLQQQAMNTQTGLVNTWQQFWGSYGPMVVVSGLVLYLILKK